MRPAEFRRVIVSGYDRTEVDEFACRVLASLAGRGGNDGLRERDIMQHRFSQAWAGTGYRKDDVDQWLDEAEHELRKRHSW